MRADDENEIRRVLRSGVRPKPMTPEEHARIIARIEQGRTEVGRTEHAGPGVLAPIDDGDDDVERRRSRRRLTMIGWAAAALVIVLIGGLITVRSSSESEPAATPPEAPLACPIEWNREYLVPLGDALDQWRSVDNWAFTQGEPDLAELVGSALAGAAGLPDPGQRERARAALDDLTARLSTIDDASIVDSLTAAETRIDAVTRGIESVNGVVGSFDERCELRTIAAGS